MKINTKKMFGGWLQTQKAKGRTVAPIKQEIDVLKKT